MIGGYDGASVPTAVLALDGARIEPARGAAWCTASGTPPPRVSGHTAYVFGGEVLGRELDTVQAVDLATGRTQRRGAAARAARTRDGRHGRRPDPADGRAGHARPADRGDVVVRPGVTAGSPAPGALPTPLSDAAVAAYGHRVWLLGGEDPVGHRRGPDNLGAVRRCLERSKTC